ncbi:MAG TPA: efflux RND transporter periplasmic adaptor subunit [Rhizomicrobium sp.]|nr:efflux RND transporter periplasmic adaptor subunit [Rhizomicrobium sp.]
MANEVPREPLSLRSQGVLVGAAALAAAGVLLLLLMPGQGAAPDSGRRMARLVPGVQQSSAMQFETVHTRLFQTETVTDGYVAANGGWTSAAAPAGTVTRGVPVLQGQSADLIQAEGDLATARAQLVAAAANERRQHALYQADGASLKDWQQAEADAATAASALAAARNKLRLLGKDEQGILALERRNDGSASRIFTIGDSSQVWLVANVREADAPHIHIGDRTLVNIPSLGGRNLSATINYIGSTVDPATHRLPVAALYRNADGVLKPNMLASFDILDRDGAQAPAVPKNAIIYEGEQARVWVVQPDGNFTLRDVAVGRSHDGYAEIARGLTAGERVVTAGALFIDQASAGG